MERRKDVHWEDDYYGDGRPSCGCVPCERGHQPRTMHGWVFHGAHGCNFKEGSVVIKAEGARGIYVLLREPNDASDTWGVLVYRLGPPFEYVYHKRFDSEETARSDFGLQCVRYAAVPLDTGENHGTIGPAGGRAI